MKCPIYDLKLMLYETLQLVSIARLRRPYPVYIWSYPPLSASLPIEFSAPEC